MATGDDAGYHQAENGDVRAVTAAAVTDAAVPLSRGKAPRSRSGR